MAPIGEYVISVTAACLVSSVVMALCGKLGTGGTIIKTLCGVFVAISILKPVVGLRFSLADLAGDWLQADAAQYVEEGQETVRKQQMAFIKQRTEAYIVQKAKALNCSLGVEIVLSNEAPYQPTGVCLQGDVSPFARQQLTSWLAETLNIPPEAQEWNN